MVGAGGAHARVGREHGLGRLAEGDADHASALGHALAGAQEERDARPAPVVHLHAGGDERLDVRVGRDAVLVAVSLVLPSHHVIGLDRHERAEDLELLVHERARLERRRRLHRDDGEHLQQVRHDHVAKGARPLVEAAARADVQRLGHVDLHVVDVLAIPHRLEEAVGEPQGQHVERRFLAQEVVDPEDLVLGEHLVHVALSSRADSRSVPNGFSMMTRARSASPASPSVRTIGPAAEAAPTGSAAGARSPPDRLLRASRHRRPARRALDGTYAEPLAERLPVVLVDAPCDRTRRSASRTCSRKASSSSSSSEVPTMR